MTPRWHKRTSRDVGRRWPRDSIIFVAAKLVARSITLILASSPVQHGGNTRQTNTQLTLNAIENVGKDSAPAPGGRFSLKEFTNSAPLHTQS